MLGGSAPADTPNVILIMADDLGWGDTGYNGHPVLQTPHLDQMSRDGIRFDRFYAAAPVCSPTRGSALTGRHPYRYGVYFANTGHMKREEFTLAEALRTKGYATGHFGKWHLGTLTTRVKDANRGKPGDSRNYSPPWENGFDVCFSTESKVPTYDPMKKPATGAPQIGWGYLKPDEAFADYGTYYWDGPESRVLRNLAGDNSRVIMDRAIPFINDSVEKKKPFFAVIWFHTPHLPVVAGPAHLAMYPDGELYTRNYYGCITAMDEQIGRLRERLATLDVDDNTMVWFASDNGPEGQAGKAPGSAGPFRGRKRSLYEGGVRVPGLLVWPGKINEARKVEVPCVTSDYLPTLLDVVGFETPPSVQPIDGISLLPLIRGETEVRPSPIGFKSRNQRALSDNRFKIHSSDEGRTWELYDLVADPGESIDLAADQENRVRRMSTLFREWEESCSASDGGADYHAGESILSPADAVAPQFSRETQRIEP